jgi:hypothetical protein
MKTNSEDTSTNSICIINLANVDHEGIGGSGLGYPPPSRRLTWASSWCGSGLPRRARRRRPSSEAARRRSRAIRRRSSETYKETRVQDKHQGGTQPNLEETEVRGVLPTERSGGRRRVVGRDGPTARSVTSTIPGSSPAAAIAGSLE